MRRLTIIIGVVLILVGARELIDSTNWTSLRATITWFLGGTLLHDGVVVPLTLLVGLARGLSNVVTASGARVSLGAGRILVIETPANLRP